MSAAADGSDSGPHAPHALAARAIRELVTSVCSAYAEIEFDGNTSLGCSMFSFITKLLDTSDFVARWNCGDWSDAHGWLHILSDVAIFGAYFAIPVVLAFFVLRRKDVPFLPIFWLFAAFILSCGIGHAIEATLFWQPWYRLSGLSKLLTAIVSWVTVIALFPLLPKALALPGLAAVNLRLQAEMSARELVEQQLRERAEQLAATNLDLERFSQTVVGREDRVTELKQQVNELLRELGREPRYGVDQTDPAQAEQIDP